MSNKKCYKYRNNSDSLTYELPRIQIRLKKKARVRVEDSYSYEMICYIYTLYTTILF